MSRDEERNEISGPGGRIRLFVESPLNQGARVEPDSGQAHYLLHVMRGGAGDTLKLFNGTDGEWRARITDATRKTCILVCEEQLRPQANVPDLWLAFAPIKKTPADYVVQKATELGVRVLQPVLTRRTIARRVNEERLHANAVEASEQSGRLSVPETRVMIGLDRLLAEWPANRKLVFCDEAGDAAPIAEALVAARGHTAQWGVLTGPEGGFDAEERAAIRERPYVLPVTLGPRIVRADTAALAALSVWQALIGDWR